MTSGYEMALSPINSAYTRDIRIHARAITAGFRPIDGPVSSASYGREWWARPDGMGLCVNYEELEEQIDFYRESWWAKEAAKWRGE